MKKIFALITVILLSVSLFVGCETKPNKQELAEEIIRCFEEKDSDGLKSVFCEEIQNMHSLDEEIRSAFDYIDGDIIDYNIEQGSDGKSVDDGKITKREFNIQIRNIKTTTQNEYLISFAYMSLNADNPEKIGISKLSVGTYDGKYVNQKTKIYIGENI